MGVVEGNGEGGWEGKRERETFPFARDFELPDDWDRHCPDNDIFEHAPGAVEDVHGDEIDAAHGVVEYFCDVPVIWYRIALEDVALLTPLSIAV